MKNVFDIPYVTLLAALFFRPEWFPKIVLTLQECEKFFLKENSQLGKKALNLSRSDWQKMRKFISDVFVEFKNR